MLLEVESEVERCKLDSIDGMQPKYPGVLTKTLGSVSVRLDKVAALVDGVETKDKERRARRKKLSKSVVRDFELCDRIKYELKVVEEDL